MTVFSVVAGSQSLRIKAPSLWITVSLSPHHQPTPANSPHSPLSPVSPLPSLVRLVSLSRLCHTRLLSIPILITISWLSGSRWRVVVLVVISSVCVTASRRLGHHWSGCNLVSARTTTAARGAASGSYQLLVNEKELGKAQYKEQHRDTDEDQYSSEDPPTPTIPV